MYNTYNKCIHNNGLKIQWQKVKIITNINNKSTIDMINNPSSHLSKIQIVKRNKIRRHQFPINENINYATTDRLIQGNAWREIRNSSIAKHNIKIKTKLNTPNHLSGLSLPIVYHTWIPLIPVAKQLKVFILNALGELY